MKIRFFLFLLCLIFNCVTGEVFCPVCEAHFENFLPGGTIFKRHNCICPICDSRERHRHLMYFIKERHPDFFSSSLTLLLWGPEPSLERKLLNLRNIYLVALNLPPWNIKPLLKNIEDLKVQLPDNSFDVIVCSHILTHVKNDKDSLKEILRLLKPEGWACIMVPIYNDLEETYQNESIQSPEERLQAYGQKDHLRKYGRNFALVLREAGFIVETYYIKDTPIELRIKYGLEGYDDNIQQNASRGADLFICKKLKS